MLIDGLKLIEGSKIENATIDFGTQLPITT
jgi:hypothetical protein